LALPTPHSSRVANRILCALQRCSRATSKNKTWLIGEWLTLADFSVGGVIPSAKAMDLSIAKYPEISRWYDKLSALPGWHGKMST
jgi:glutathione S-transferase